MKMITLLYPAISPSPFGEGRGGATGGEGDATPDLIYKWLIVQLIKAMINCIGQGAE